MEGIATIITLIRDVRHDKRYIQSLNSVNTFRDCLCILVSMFSHGETNLGRVLIATIFLMDVLRKIGRCVFMHNEIPARADKPLR